MKKAIVLIGISLFAFSYSVMSQKYPKISEKNKIDGSIVIRKGIYKNKSYNKLPGKLNADFIKIAVKENRSNSESTVITLPVLRLHSVSENPKEPVFLFNGGPGGTNLQNFAPWLLEKHDLVMVGYRGVDGSVRLDSKAFGKALVVDSNAFSEQHLKQLGKVWKKEMQKLENKGVDFNSYNIVEEVDDIETVRKLLNYKKINLFGVSKGTRDAYIYSLRYPQNINRSCMALVNTPGHFYHNPDTLDNILLKYGEIWNKDSISRMYSKDIISTIRKVFETLPTKWKKVYIDPGKVRFMMYNYLQSIGGAKQIFDAFVAAENEDYSGLACLVMMYDLIPIVRKTTWGDFISKAATVDYDPEQNYTSGTDSKQNLLGAPLSKFFALAEYSDYDVRMIPEKYRKLDTCRVNTLLFNGNLDVATPPSNARELANYLPNAQLITITDCSHFDLFFSKEFETNQELVKQYFLTGKVDKNAIKHIPAKFGKPGNTLQNMGNKFYKIKKLGLLKFIARFVKVK